MWIRSQNEEYLINTNYFEIAGYDNQSVFDIDAKVEDKWVTLGTYSTKEKALKVLEWIQIHLLDLENAKNMNFALNNFAFQMPKDDEVE